MPTQLHRYGDAVNSHDLLKFAAILFMITDHFGLYCFPDIITLRIIGRMAAPLFFFLIGYTQSQKLPKTWLLLGLILTFSNWATSGQITFDILINFFLIRLLFRHFNTQTLSPLWLLGIFCLLAALSPFIQLEYGSSGLIIALAAQRIAHHKKDGPWFIVLALLIYWILEYRHFNITPTAYHLSLILFEAIIMGLLMCRYHLKTWPYPRFFRLPTLIISRYSLMFYFWHLLLFESLFFALHWSDYAPVIHKLTG